MKKILAAALAVTLTFGSSAAVFAEPAASPDLIDAYESLLSDSADDNSLADDTSTAADTDDSADSAEDTSSETEENSAADTKSADESAADVNTADITAEASVPKGLKYKADNDGNITITGFKSKAKSLTIPAEIDGKPVTAIGEAAFQENTTLEKIVIPEGVESIGDMAFYACENLSDITIPSTVQDFGMLAFIESAWLNNKVAENQYVVVNDVLVSANYVVGTAKVPDGVKRIGSGAFAGALVFSVKIPDSVTQIDEGAFMLCMALYRITIPASVESIGDAAFSMCLSLESVDIKPGVKTIGEAAFAATSLKTVKIPESVESVGSSAFSLCDSLKTVIISKSVKTIGTEAFADSPVKNIWYTGSADEWNAIEGDFRKDIKSAKMHCNKPESLRLISEARIKLSSSKYVYDGKTKTPEVRAYLGGKKLTLNKDFTVSYSNNKNIGMATVTVKGCGEYSGSFSKTFKISTAKQKITKIKAAKGGFTAKWKKQSMADGYQLKYANNSDFENGRSKYVKTNSTTSLSVSKLRSGKTCFVKVRSYTTVGGKKIYGDWSDVKVITTK